MQSYQERRNVDATPEKEAESEQMRDIVLAYIVGLASAFVIAFGLFAGIVFKAEDANEKKKT